RQGPTAGLPAQSRVRRPMAHAIRMHETGGPEVLQVEEVAVGDPGPGQVRLRHVAVGLNFADTYFRAGVYPVPLPAGMGVEAAGVVETVGPGVTSVAAGDRVTYTGFVNTLGAYSTERIIPVARAHGCDHVINCRHEDVAKRVRELTGGVGVSVVYDSVGKDTFAGSIDSLKRRGLLVCVGTASGPVPPIDATQLAIKGSVYVTRPALADYIADPAEKHALANEVFGHVAAGRIRIEINQRYRLQDAAQAHRDLEARRTTGSSIFVI